MIIDQLEHAKVQDYRTKPREQGFWEAHRAYIDVQYVASGCESIGYAHISRLRAGRYDAEADLLKLEGEGEYVTARPGTFVILFPQDAHMPAIAVGTPGPVRKIVVKVRV
jgi:biofilm protein TabA